MRSTSDFEEFAVARTPHLFRTAWLLTGDYHHAEDLVQETLARMFATWRKVTMENAGAYAQTVLVRLFISQRRRRSSTERPVDSLPEIRADDDDSALRLALRAALNELSPLDRAVLVLRYFEDRSTEQVAQDLGRTNAAIRNRTSRALTRIREVLGDDLAQLRFS